MGRNGSSFALFLKIAKPDSATVTVDDSCCTCLGYLKQHNTSRTNSMRVMSPKMGRGSAAIASAEGSFLGGFIEFLVNDDS